MFIGDNCSYSDERAYPTCVTDIELKSTDARTGANLSKKKTRSTQLQIRGSKRKHKTGKRFRYRVYTKGRGCTPSAAGSRHTAHKEEGPRVVCSPGVQQWGRSRRRRRRREASRHRNSRGALASRRAHGRLGWPASRFGPPLPVGGREFSGAVGRAVSHAWPETAAAPRPTAFTPELADPNSPVAPLCRARPPTLSAQIIAASDQWSAACGRDVTSRPLHGGPRTRPVNGASH